MLYITYKDMVKYHTIENVEIRSQLKKVSNSDNPWQLNNQGS